MAVAMECLLHVQVVKLLRTISISFPAVTALNTFCYSYQRKQFSGSIEHIKNNFKVGQDDSLGRKSFLFDSNPSVNNE